MSWGRQAAQGAFWNYAAFLVSKGLLFVATLVLARVLPKEDFGLVSMALLIITAFDILRDAGIGAALIYHQGDPRPAADLAFVLSAGLGIGLFIANWLLAPWLALYFSTDSHDDLALLTSMVQILGLTLFFASLGSTQDALLQKDINYRRRMIPEVGRTAIKGGLQVVLALTGWGVWSLVYGQVIGEAGATLLLWGVARWRPTFRPDWKLLRPIAGYGAQMISISGLGWLIADLDYLIIGRLLGAVPLAIYTLGFRIPEMVIRNLALSVATVAFPVTARLQADLKALRDAYLTMQHYMLMLLAPLSFGLYATTPVLMRLLFGTKWEATIPVMKVLCLYMLVSGVGTWAGVVYKAVGRPDILNKLAIVNLVLLAPVLWWCTEHGGIVAVAWGQVVMRLVYMVMHLIVVARFVHISVVANLRVIWPPIAAAGLMALAVRAVWLLDPSQTSVLVLALAVVVGGATYLGLMWLIDRRALQALLTFGWGFLSRGRPAGTPQPVTNT